MLSRLKAWWTTPSALELELKATRRAAAESALKIRDLNDQVRVLKFEKGLLAGKLDDRVRYVDFLESEIRRLNEEQGRRRRRPL